LEQILIHHKARHFALLRLMVGDGVSHREPEDTAQAIERRNSRGEERAQASS